MPDSTFVEEFGDRYTETDPYEVPGSRDMSLLDKALAKRRLIESRPDKLPFEGGEGIDYSFTTSTATPRVPVAPEDTFFDKQYPDIDTPRTDIFDEASWTEGRNRLFKVADEQIPWQKRFFPDKTKGFDPRY